ncbi:hypothetical protein J5S49_02245 [Virgibacillus halodenitrificans]|uniref:hypothetical protein n=1 Tax=Virgibacillus halodenitrificans TaxID=1482 RepID=UPI001F3C57FA|nr:hypothetical protein [Virgibacillus halodenitrificans]MCG1027110.1 hypothetical protein [Virgibacillus halodenitrificans]
MSWKKCLSLCTILLLGCLALGACQNNETDETADNTSSAKQNSEEKGSEQDAAQSNSSTHPDGNVLQILTLQKIWTSKKQKAVSAVKGYNNVEQTNMDLGHGVQAFAEGATGHTYISWNEGKWYIEINSPTDTKYQMSTFKNGKALAKNVVDYLEANYLPAPDEKGVIKINSFKKHPSTSIEWQQGNTVYKIDQNTEKPLDTLDLAVDTGKELQSS